MLRDIDDYELDRFMAKVHTTGGCWFWQATVTHEGYGTHYIGGKGVRAHRWIWEALVGDIPDGLELDHWCVNPICVNPDHLEPVTGAENQRRRKSNSGRIAKENRTHCRNGHARAEVQIYHQDSHPTSDICKPCKQVLNRKAYLKRSEGKGLVRRNSKNAALLNTELL